MSVRVDRLSFAYGRRRVLDDVSFTAEPGTVTAILGPNGVGKSTLLRAIAGLVRVPDGALCVRGKIGFLPQDTSARGALTVFETVLLGRIRHLGLVVGRADRDATAASLSRVGIAHLADRYVDEVSGGQRQLVFLAQILASEASILLLDEPTASLDLRFGLAVLGLVRSLTRSEGVTTILTIHDVNGAARYADQCVVLADGRVAAAGEARRVITAEMLANVYGIEVAIGRCPAGLLTVAPTRSLT